MKILKNKSKIPTIALVLVLTAATIFICLPGANAVLLTDRDTYAFVAVSPNPIGVGQTALVTMWLAEFLPSAQWGWEYYELTVVGPGGTEILGPYKSESTGSTWTKYVPDQTGEYTFQMSFDGMWVNQTLYDFFGNPIGTSEQWFKPSTSQVATLTVQEEAIQWLPGAELPTDYWERPIYGENREWHTIAGPMLETAAGFNLGNVVPYTDGSDTPHIMWTREVDFGGIVGGDDEHGYYSGLSYERKWAGLIMQGRVYFNLYPAGFGGSYQTGFVCVDLRTGEELFRNNEGRISFGQILWFDSGNQHGNIAYLWESVGGGTYRMYNAKDGFWICDLVDVPSGTRVRGPDGEILIYNLYTENNTRKLSLWNSTHVQGFSTGWGGYSWSWRPPQGGTVNATDGVMWVKNVTSVPGDPGVNRLDYDEGILYCRAQVGDPPVAIHCAYDIHTGALLFQKNHTGLLGAVNFVNTGPLGEGVYVEYIKETTRWVAYDARTGNVKWTSEPAKNSWGHYLGAMAIAYGKLYATTYDGYLHCIDLDTGNEDWAYFSGSSGFETPYGHYPFFTFHDAFTIADEKVYVVTGEHSPNDPLYRGEKLHCVDANTGEGLWNISCWGVPPAVAEGYVVTINHYDNRLYCYGKGPSKTTVTAPQIVIPLGSSVMITGTVTDQSTAGAGTPCVSLESMEAWMGYLHMQKPMPMDTTGVTVSLDTLDPNFNFIHIGMVTSDGSGMFKKMFTPEVPGEYTIIATCLGDESYGSSFAECAIGVGPAPEEPTEPATPEGVQEDINASINSLTPMFLGIIVAVVIAIVIGLLNFWSIRKRK